MGQNFQKMFHLLEANYFGLNSLLVVMEPISVNSIWFLINRLDLTIKKIPKSLLQYPFLIVTNASSLFCFHQKCDARLRQ